MALVGGPNSVEKATRSFKSLLVGGEAIILSYSMKYNYKCFKNKPQKIDGFIQAGDGFSGETKSIYKKMLKLLQTASNTLKR